MKRVSRQRTKGRTRWQVTDPLRRQVICTKSAYAHIINRHPQEGILETSVKKGIQKPISIWRDIAENSQVWYYFIAIEKSTMKLLGMDKYYLMAVAKRKEKTVFIATWYKVIDVTKKGGKQIWPRP